jgi:hypothetical protein
MSIIAWRHPAIRHLRSMGRRKVGTLSQCSHGIMVDIVWTRGLAKRFPHSKEWGKFYETVTWLPECHTERTYRDSFPHLAQWPLKRRAKQKERMKSPLWKEMAEHWTAGLAAGTWPSRAALARAEGVTRAYVTQVLGRLNNKAKG